MSFRDRFFTPKVARAVTSPLAIGATGIGAAVGILIGAGPIGAIGLGVAAFVGRVLVAVPRGDKKERIDPFALNEPWRSLTADAVQARQQFGETVRRAREGPLRDALADTQHRLEAGVEECWRIAKSGQTLAEAFRSIDTIGAQRTLDSVMSDGRLADDPTKAATIAALEAQLSSAKRMADTIEGARAQLELLNARLDEAVARTVELTATGSTTVDLSGIDRDVAGVTMEMEALRQGLEATAQASPGL